MTNNHSSQSVGGAYSDLRKLYQGTGQVKEIHHIPAYSAYKNVTSLSRDQGSSIVMSKADHQETASYGNDKQARAYCNEQKKLVAAGKIDAAFEMDKTDLKSKFGSKYDPAIRQAESYLHQKVIPHLKSSPSSKTPDKLQHLKHDYPQGERLNVGIPQNSPISSQPTKNASPNR
jgi:hypothetical protein